MQNNVETRGYEHFDDLHIDKIDQSWETPDSWVTGGLTAFNISVALRDEIAPDLVLALAFSIAKPESDAGAEITSVDDIRFDQSPPALYLFKKGSEPWAATLTEGARRRLEPSFFGELSAPYSCYYIEFRLQAFDEYSRTLLIAA